MSDINGILWQKCAQLYLHRGVHFDALNTPLNLVFRASAKVHGEIYHIDKAFEASKKVHLPSIKPMWQRTFSQLQGIGMRETDRTEELIEKIQKYQIVEERFHDGDTLGSGEIQNIALLKSADVTMARSIIWGLRDKKHRNPSSHYEQSLRYIDAANEILEDFGDIREDLTDFNFNFVLASTKSKVEGRWDAGNLLDAAENLLSTAEDLGNFASHHEQSILKLLISESSRKLDAVKTFVTFRETSIRTFENGFVTATIPTVFSIERNLVGKLEL